MYRPYLVTRQERECFKLVGDKVDQKVRTHQKLETKVERDNYWSRAMAQGLAKMK